MRFYRIDWVRDRDYGLGKRGVAAPGPFTHREACTVKTKQTPHKGLRYEFVEIPGPRYEVWFAPNHCDANARTLDRFYDVEKALAFACTQSTDLECPVYVDDAIDREPIATFQSGIKVSL